MAAEGEVGPGGRRNSEVLLTAGLIMIKWCTSQVRRSGHPLEGEKREENCPGHVLAGCLIPGKGKCGLTRDLGLTLLALKGIKVEALLPVSNGWSWPHLSYTGAFQKKKKIKPKIRVIHKATDFTFV